MEVLAMGPKRGRDGLRPSDSTPTLDPLELITEPAEGESADIEDVAQGAGPDTHADGEHWLTGLLRADILAVSAAAAVLVAVLGLPFMETINMTFLYGLPDGSRTAWLFVPTLITTAGALALGLAGLRQATREGAATWVRITAGVATFVSALLWLGSAVAWWYMANSDVFDRFAG
jgi:hypothetical protein